MRGYDYLREYVYLFLSILPGGTFIWKSRVATLHCEQGLWPFKNQKYFILHSDFAQGTFLKDSSIWMSNTMLDKCLVLFLDLESISILKKKKAFFNKGNLSWNTKRLKSLERLHYFHWMKIYETFAKILQTFWDSAKILKF